MRNLARQHDISCNLSREWVRKYEAGAFDAEQVMKRSAYSAGFEVLPRRWGVARTFAWLNRSRRLGMDFETTIANAVGWIHVVQNQRLTRGPAKP